IAESNYRLQKSANLPDINLGYVNQSLIGIHQVNGSDKFLGSTNRFNSVNVGLSIGLFTTNAAKTKALNYEKQAAEALVQQQQKQLQTDFSNAINQYKQL